MMKEGAKLPPNGSSSLIGKYRKALQFVRLLGDKVKDLENKLEKSEADKEYLDTLNDENRDMIRELRQENAALKDNWRKTQKEKAGKASALVRMKRKFDDMEEESEEDIGATYRNKSVQTNVNLREEEQLIKVVRDTSSKLKNIEVLTGKEEKSDEKRSYGESTYVRLPSARTTWPNTKVSTRAVQGRAAFVRDFISLISGSSVDGEKEESDDIDRFLFIQLIKQNKEIFKDLLRSSKVCQFLAFRCSKS